MAVQQEVVVPDIGDFKNIEIIEILVKPGDTVKPEDPLLTLESDKAAMEVPAPQGGVVRDIQVKVGDRVSKGTPILVLDLVEGAPAAVPEGQAAEAPLVEQEVVVPDIGDFKNIKIIEILVKPGDTVKPDDPLITLESDKAAMEVPAPRGGVVRNILVEVGDRVSKGSPILVLAASGGTQASAPAPEVPAAQGTEPALSAPKPQARPAPRALPESAEGRAAPPHASPSVRKFARELGADLGRMRGTGPKNRILKEDVQNFVKESLKRPAAPQGLLALAPAPVIDFAQFGEIERRPLTRIQKLSGPNLHRNWVGIPHVTQYDEADITDLEAFRVSLKTEAEQRGVKLSLLPFVMKAVARALRAFPNFNASLSPEGEDLILKRYVHLGVAVDTPEGLVVPVIRDVDRKSLFDLAAELAAVGERARGKKLRNKDLEGGCFTISSLGGIGGTAFTPIINAPEVAILGLSKAQMKPVWREGGFQPRLLLPLSLSYDHRVIDGAQAARFAVYLSSVLADLRRVLL